MNSSSIERFQALVNAAGKAAVIDNHRITPKSPLLAKEHDLNITKSRMNEPSKMPPVSLRNSNHGGWHSKNDLKDRRRIIVSVLKLLKHMNMRQSQETIQQLPMVARKMEQYLYHSALSKEQYMDKFTLKKRLQTLAHGLEIHRSSSKCHEKASNGDAKKLWQSSADESDRMLMCDNILKLLETLSPEKNSEKLAKMAMKLEEYVYRSALTKKEYLNESTLRERVQLVSRALKLHRLMRCGI